MKLWGVAAVLLLALACSGCESLSQFRGEGFSEADQQLSEWTGRFRAKDHSASAWGWSSKAQQIERSVGVK